MPVVSQTNIQHTITVTDINDNIKMVINIDNDDPKIPIEIDDVYEGWCSVEEAEQLVEALKTAIDIAKKLVV